MNRAATVRKRFLSASPDRFLTVAARIGRTRHLNRNKALIVAKASRSRFVSLTAKSMGRPIRSATLHLITPGVYGKRWPKKRVRERIHAPAVDSRTSRSCR